MTGFLRDDGQRKFFYCMITILLAASVFTTIIWYMNGYRIKKNTLYHDRCVISSLIDQGISEAVIANAFSGKEITQKGSELLTRLGISEETELFFMPGIIDLQRQTGMQLTLLFLFLWISLLSLTGLFFCSREKIYSQAIRIIDQFMNGNFDEHLPRTGDGCLYRLFGKIDGLANALFAEKEEVLQTKDFLKNTISDISHQLKTPLSALSMYNEIIETEAASDTGKNEIILDFTGKASAAIERVGTLIQALLKVTRLDAGAVVFEKQLWLLKDVISKAISELQVRARREEKEILLSGADEIWVSCDLQWTGEAIRNLVKNALDHTEKGARIVISWEKFPEMTKLSVLDDGSGIKEEDIYYIFKRFYRAKTERKNGQGIGLGLPLAKSITEGQGGTLSVQSSPGKGAVFTMTLPA